MTETMSTHGLVAELATMLEQMGNELDGLLAPLADWQWSTDTPAEGWTIAHQVAHLAWTDRQSLAALEDPEAFDRVLDAAAEDPHGVVEAGAREGLDEAGSALSARWRAGRQRLAAAIVAADPGVPVRWFGPPMKPASMVTARIMETFAHGLDIADALAVPPVGLVGLRQVCHLGVRTRDYSFARRDIEAPADEFRVDLRGPRGESWAWGPVDAEQTVRGPALDFAMLVTRRRHHADLDLVVEGRDARRWLDIAQAFAGPAGSGRLTAASVDGSE